MDKRYPWYRTFALECLGFPNSRYKDQVDTLSLGALVITKIEQHMRQERQEEALEEVVHVA